MEESPVVISDTFMSDLSSTRPAATDSVDEFDDPSSTPLPSPLPPDSEFVEAVRIGLEVRAPEAQPLDEDELQQSPRTGRGAKIAIVSVLVAGMVSIVVAFGVSKKAPVDEHPFMKTVAVPKPVTPSTAPRRHRRSRPSRRRLPQ